MNTVVQLAMQDTSSSRSTRIGRRSSCNRTSRTLTAISRMHSRSGARWPRRRRATTRRCSCARRTPTRSTTWRISSASRDRWTWPCASTSRCVAPLPSPFLSPLLPSPHRRSRASLGVPELPVSLIASLPLIAAGNHEISSDAQTWVGCALRFYLNLLF